MPVIETAIKILQKTYPEAKCDLKFKNAWQLLVSTMLSAQTTDKSVIKVTPELFKKYPTPKALAAAKLAVIEKIIKPIGLYKTKSKNIINTAKMITEEFASKVPGDLAALQKLPGVGRKTANVVLGNWFNIPSLAVDTHVTRISKRLGLTKQTDPKKIEPDLQKKIPKKYWVEITHLLIRLGRSICVPRKPKCNICPIEKFCPKILS